MQPESPLSARTCGRRKRSRARPAEARVEESRWIASALRRYVQWLRSLGSIKLRMVIFFGSYTKGTWRPGSDVDLVVVAEGLPEDTVDCHVLLTDVPRGIAGVGFQAHPYAPGDFLASLRSGNRMPLDALAEGQILYIEDGYRKKLLAAV